MSEKNRNLVLRLVSAVVLLPVVLWLLVRGGAYAGGLMAVAAALCVAEYYLIVLKKLSPVAVLGVGAAGALPLVASFYPDQVTAFGFGAVAGLFFLAWVYHLLTGPLTEGPDRAAHLVTGLVYGSTGLAALAAVRVGVDGFWWVVCALVITWANDTCAYFAGRFLGKHKLYPEVSPNKTWEGFAGGLLGSVGGLFVVRAVGFDALSALDCVVLGLAGGVVAPLGDLCESMLKRAYQVKDSGRLIPGHGGLLDRIDALLFNGPLVYLYVEHVRTWL